MLNLACSNVNISRRKCIKKNTKVKITDIRISSEKYMALMVENRNEDISPLKMEKMKNYGSKKQKYSST